VAGGRNHTTNMDWSSQPNKPGGVVCQAGLQGPPVGLGWYKIPLFERYSVQSGAMLKAGGSIVMVSPAVIGMPDCGELFMVGVVVIEAGIAPSDFILSDAEMLDEIELGCGLIAPKRVCSQVMVPRVEQAEAVSVTAVFDPEGSRLHPVLVAVHSVMLEHSFVSVKVVVIAGAIADAVIDIAQLVVVTQSVIVDVEHCESNLITTPNNRNIHTSLEVDSAEVIELLGADVGLTLGFVEGLPGEAVVSDPVSSSITGGHVSINNIFQHLGSLITGSFGNLIRMFGNLGSLNS
jgi:hypothetical protein